jgi:hypothetical protein
MSVLAQAVAAEAEVEAAWQELADPPAYRLVRGPETGLVMVQFVRVMLQGRHDTPLPAAVATISPTPAQRVAWTTAERSLRAGADLIRVRTVDDLPVVLAVWRGRQRVA